MGQAVLGGCHPPGPDWIATKVTSRQDEFERTAIPHSGSLLRVARRLASDPATAEDLVQETFYRAWRSFEQFQTGTNIRAWLFRILFNAFYAQRRQMSATPILVSLETPGVEPGPTRPTAISFADAAEVSSALDALSSEHRTVLLLAVVEGFTCREMAQILDLPIGTVMSRLSRGRQAMRDRLAPAAPKVMEARAGFGREREAG
ncbi:MAG: sigma-70 family RNA polymerase sigma factor [Candidatus Acidiferrales bacterium]